MSGLSNPDETAWRSYVSYDQRDAPKEGNTSSCLLFGVEQSLAQPESKQSQRNGYEIETRGAILFLEDVDEEPYSIDRMLTHLRFAGKFDGVAGVIFGECQDCRPKDYKPSTTIPYGLGEVLDNILGALKIPVLYGLTIGHTDDQLTLPLGVTATLDATNGTLEIKEAGVQ